MPLLSSVCTAVDAFLALLLLLRFAFCFFPMLLGFSWDDDSSPSSPDSAPPPPSNSDIVSTSSGETTIALLSPSSTIAALFPSSFFRSSHHSEPAASHACDSTECTICAVSKPSSASVFSSCRSGGVENITGVRALSRLAKSRSRAAGMGSGVGVFSSVGEAVIEDTERRFVRAGVRWCEDGGGFEPMPGKGEGARCFGSSPSRSSSSTVAGGCLSPVLASLEDSDSKSDVDDFRMVISLRWRWMAPCFVATLLSELSKGSLRDSSGVVGLDDPRSGCFIRGDSDSCVEACDESGAVLLSESRRVPSLGEGGRVKGSGGAAESGDSCS